MTTYGITTRGPYWHTHATRISLSTSTHSNANDSISNSIDFASLTYSSLSIRDHRTTPHFSLLSENHSARARRTAPIPWTHPSELYYTPWLSVPTRTRLHTSRALSTYTPKQTYNPPHPHQSLTLLERTHVLIRSDDIITVFSALALSLSLEPSAAAYPTHRGGPLACVPGRPLVRAASIVALKPRNSFAVPVSPSLVSHIIAKCISYVSHCCNMPVQRKNRLQ